MQIHTHVLPCRNLHFIPKTELCVCVCVHGETKRPSYVSQQKKKRYLGVSLMQLASLGFKQRRLGVQEH